MKSKISPFALILALICLSSCGGETEEPEDDHPKSADTRPIPSEKPEKTEVAKTDEDAERERRRAEGEERGRKWFESQDKDGDGAVTQEESGNLAWVFLHMADEDGDGKVTGDEAAKAAEEARSGNFRSPESTKIIEIMDTDGDGMIGGTELPERMRERVSMADMDGDGKISLVEVEIINAQMAAMRSAMQNRNRDGENGGGGDTPDL